MRLDHGKRTGCVYGSSVSGLGCRDIECNGVGSNESKKWARATASEHSVSIVDVPER